MRLLFWVLLSALTTMLTSAAVPQRAAVRVALIIGNTNYPGANIPTAAIRKDTRALADEFRQMNFSVDLKENLGKEDMRRAIDAFTSKIKNGTVALFYFNGIGIQADRKSYLLPVNAKVWTAADVASDGVSIDAILAEMDRRGAKVKIIIIDAARRNPFERRFRASPAGLASLGAPAGTLALYSAAPGNIARDSTGTNSIFVTALIKVLKSPNHTAEEAFSRARIEVAHASKNESVPWVTSSLVETFYFRPPQSAALADKPVPARTATLPRAQSTAPSAQELECNTTYKVNTNEVNISKDAGGHIYIDVLEVGAVACITRRQNVDGGEWGFVAHKTAKPNGTVPVNGWVAMRSMEQISSAKPTALSGMAQTATAAADVLYFDQPVPFGPYPVNGQSLKQLAESVPLFPPIEGLDAALWKKKCDTCHKWNQARLCKQGETYVKAARYALRHQHPFGGAYKIALMKWSKSGCK